MKYYIILIMLICVNCYSAYIPKTKITAGTGISISGSFTISASTGMPTGAVIVYSAAACPEGYLVADGSALSIAGAYSSLFSIIGTTWGATISGNFYLPDLRGVYIRGSGTSGVQDMAAGGNYAGGPVATFTDDRMQGHWHIVRSANGQVIYEQNGASSERTPTVNSGALLTAEFIARNLTTDGSNGTPRSGNETNPGTFTMVFCIKY